MNKSIWRTLEQHQENKLAEDRKLAMESEKHEEEEKPGGNFLTAGRYHEQGRNSIGDDGRDERMQAGDFLRGMKGDEPSSALLQSADDCDCLEITSTKQSKAEVPSDDVKSVSERPGDVPGEENPNAGNASSLSSSSTQLPHKVVPQPGQYTDMDAVVKFLTLGD